jgi:uridine phosphorylase
MALGEYDRRQALSTRATPLCKQRRKRMPFHINGDPAAIGRYVFCPGSQARARRLAEQFSDKQTVSDRRGLVVYSGTYEGVFMTVCGTGMGGPATAIACEELAQLGADTFIRVGSCGVLQEGQEPGDIIVASGSYRGGGTANAYLPLPFPAVPTFAVVRALVQAASDLDVAVTTGVGISSDAFYGPQLPAEIETVRAGGGCFIEMESDTLFILGHARGWRTGALFTADGTRDEIKPAWGEAAYKAGEAKMIAVALAAMHKLALSDKLT